MTKILPVAEPCPICFSDDIESFVKLDCTHSLCDICYEEWHIKKKKNRCTICRQKITSLPEDENEDMFYDDNYNSGLTVNIDGEHACGWLAIAFMSCSLDCSCHLDCIKVFV